MNRLTLFRVLATLLVTTGIILSLAGCGSGVGGGAENAITVSYTTPFIPVTFSIDSNGNIGVSTGINIVTELGEISVSVGSAISAFAVQANSLLLTVRHQENGNLVDTGYQINTGGVGSADVQGDINEVKVAWNGQNNTIFIDASKGDITSIVIQGNTSSITTNVPTQVPTNPPNPSAPGTILYQSDANWLGWSANQWGILNGQLETNGRGDTWIKVPYSPGQHGISNYSVEATIDLVAYNGCYYCGFGIAARADNNNNGYLLAVCAVAGFQVCGGNNNINYQAQLVIGQDFVNGSVPYLTQYQTPEKQTITYRIECKGDIITGYISENNVVLGPLTDLTTTTGGNVLLFTDNAQLLISSVVIKAL